MYKSKQFRNTDLCYIVEYDYERSACTCDESICRCTTIENAHVTDLVDVDKIIHTIVESQFGRMFVNEIDAYCFNRLCYLYGIYNADNYSVDVCNGYYGEEVNGVTFDNEREVVEEFKEIMNLSAVDKIKFVLKKEYGYLLPEIEACNYVTCEECDIHKLRAQQTEHFRKLETDVIDSYTNSYAFPIGVCVSTTNGLRLLDGYHRLASKIKMGEDVVPVIIIRERGNND